MDEMIREMNERMVETNKEMNEGGDEWTNELVK